VTGNVAMILSLRIILAVCVLGMTWWALLWPFAVGPGADNRVFHVGSITTLALFLACTVAILVLRRRSHRSPGA
jgi:hypothetical protein